MVAGTLFFATAGQNMWGWLLWIALPDALLPALLLGRFGMEQRAGILEELATQRPAAEIRTGSFARVRLMPEPSARPRA